MPRAKLNPLQGMRAIAFAWMDPPLLVSIRRRLRAFVDGEIPFGSIDGVNSYYTLQTAPVPSTSLQLYRNGVYQTSGVDFTVSSTSIRFLTGAVPQQGDSVLASYRVGGTRATSTQQLNTAYPLTGGGPLQNTLTLGLADAAFLRRGHKAMVLGDSFAANGASWAIPANWFAQSAVQSRSAIRYLGNAGIAGDTLANMLARLSTDVIAKSPDKVFIGAGSTDIAAGVLPATAAAKVGSIVIALKAANILPILCSIPPVSGFLTATTNYNLQLQLIATQQGVPFIDFSPAITDPTTGLIFSAYGTDISNLSGVANRNMASVVTTATASLFDAAYPWIPTSDKDGVNMIADPMFQKNPSGWSAITVSGSTALSFSTNSDFTITGKAATLTKSDPASVNALKGTAITTGFAPGDRIAFVGRIKTSSVEYSGLSFDVGLQFTPGINLFYPMYHWQADIRDGQWYAETVVPAGVTAITPFFQLNQGAGTVITGQIGLINLTALGL